MPSDELAQTPMTASIFHDSCSHLKYDAGCGGGGGDAEGGRGDGEAGGGDGGGGNGCGGGLGGTTILVSDACRSSAETPRAVESAETIAPAENEDAAAEAAASAPPACVNDMVAEVMVNTGVASVRFVALSAEEREAVRADTMDVVTLVSIASETLAPGTTVMTKTTTPASDNDRPA
jgi:hypothetical protein